MITIPKARTGLATAGPDQDPGTVPQTGPDQKTDPDPGVTGGRAENHGRGPGRPQEGPGTSPGRPGWSPVQDGRVERRKSGPTTSSSQPRQVIITTFFRYLFAIHRTKKSIIILFLISPSV